jgi:ATP-dependent DNA ligase
LESIVSGIDGLTFSEAIEGDGAIVFDHACRLGLEGIVSKRLGGLYAAAGVGTGEGQEPEISTSVRQPKA